VSLTQEHNADTLSKLDEWVTKTDFHYKFRVPYSLISREVDRCRISIKLDVDGKIKTHLEEAKQAFNKSDLFRN
jgi:hypothetical protein